MDDSFGINKIETWPDLASVLERTIESGQISGQNGPIPRKVVMGPAMFTIISRNSYPFPKFQEQVRLTSWRIPVEINYHMTDHAVIVIWEKE